MRASLPDAETARDGETLAQRHPDGAAAADRGPGPRSWARHAGHLPRPGIVAA